MGNRGFARPGAAADGGALEGAAARRGQFGDAGAELNTKDAEANENLADSNGETPLRLARSRGYARIERILVAAGGR